jgi:hypothetical protein
MNRMKTPLDDQLLQLLDTGPHSIRALMAAANECDPRDVPLDRMHLCSIRLHALAEKGLIHSRPGPRTSLIWIAGPAPAMPDAPAKPKKRKARDETPPPPKFDSSALQSAFGMAPPPSQPRGRVIAGPAGDIRARGGYVGRWTA